MMDSIFDILQGPWGDPLPPGISRAGPLWPDTECWLWNNNFNKTGGYALTNFESIHILRLRKTRQTVGMNEMEWWPCYESNGGNVPLFKREHAHYISLFRD